MLHWLVGAPPNHRARPVRVRAASAACLWPAQGGWPPCAWGVAPARHAGHTCHALPVWLGWAAARGGLGCASWVPWQQAQRPRLLLGAAGAGGHAQAVSISSCWLKSRLPVCPKVTLGLRASSLLPGGAGCLQTAWPESKTVLEHPCDQQRMASSLPGLKQTRGAGRPRRVSPPLN